MQSNFIAQFLRQPILKDTDGRSWRMKHSRDRRQHVSFPAGLSTRKASQVGEGRAGSYADLDICISDGLPEPIGAVRTVSSGVPANQHA